MEDKNLENLFKDKLGTMVVEPSAGANEKFTARLKGRHQRILFRRLSIAASIILMLIAGAIGFFPGDQEREEIAEQPSVVSKPSNDLAALQDKILPERNESSLEDMQGDNQVPIAAASREKSGQPAVMDDLTGIRSSDADEAREEKELKMVGNTEIPGKIQVVKPSGELPSAEYGPSDISQLHEVKPQGPFIAGEDMVDGGDLLEDNAGYNGQEQTKPYKITIEYIAAGSKDEGSRSKFREFYSKMDNMKGVDGMIGDLREYKDRLFALEFRNDNKVKDEK